MSAVADELPVIETLLCHAHVPMAVRCLGSLRRCHQPAYRLRVRDDGTLTDEDCARLEAEQPGTVFVRRKDADGPMRELLARYPTCQHYREHYPISLKFMDLPLLATGPVVFCDSDIFFVRRFTGFHRLIDPAHPLIFTRDLTMAYAVRYWHLLGRGRLRLMSRTNSGVMVIDPRTADLDFMEWFLARLETGKIHHVVEQTYWSAQAVQVGGCRYLDPAQIHYPPTDVKAARLPLPSGLVAWHLISPLRKWLPRLEEAPLAAAEREEPVDLRTVAARKLGLPYYVVSRLGKQVRYWQGKAL